MKSSNGLLRLLWITMMLCLSYPVFSQTATYKYNTRVNDNINGYYEYLPASYFSEPTKDLPLFFYFQGLGTFGNGKPGQLEWTTSLWGSPPDRTMRQFTNPKYFGLFPDPFSVNGISREFILICPQFEIDPQKKGTVYRDINDLISYFEKHYRINTRRIYLGGNSAGGAFAMDYISSNLDNAQKIAALISSSPAMGGSQQRANIISKARIPIWLAAADHDGGYANNVRGWVNLINNAAPKPYYPPRSSIVPGTNHSVASAYLNDPKTKVDGKNIYEWLLQYERQPTWGPLPVTGLQLIASTSNHYIILHWQTQTETNNKGFSVERSSDGVHFQSIDFVPSSSVNNLGNSYSYTDRNPLPSINYYRLQQTDKDGLSTYSKIVTAFLNSSSEIKVFPNPVHDALSIQLATPLLHARLQIFNAEGKLCKETLIGNTRKIRVPVNHLAKGVYNARIYTPKSKFHFTFIIN